MEQRQGQIARPELLAPAGDGECLRAAVGNGADAVYFGLGNFNARRRAANFSLKELAQTMQYLHSHNVRGYVALNTLIFPSELAEAARCVRAIAAAGADAVIVQDLGLARLIGRFAPDLPMHASTQMTVTDARGIELVRKLGIRRVILARELSMAQIVAIRAACDMPLEVFVHGALCLSYSGQCNASQRFLGRSANRGQCDQPCRLPYEVIVDAQESGQAADDAKAPRPYPLSTRDLAAYDRIAELTWLGIAGFKIEGRMKGPTYVAAVMHVYRAAIDAALAGRPFELSAQQRQQLAQSFSRGFCHGWLDGDDHQGLVHGRFPNSRGVRVGKVVNKTDCGIVVFIDAIAGVDGDGAGEMAAVQLKNGDGIVFDSGQPGFQEQGGRIYAVRNWNLAGGNILELRFGKDDVDVSAVPVGAAVWKTDDPAVRGELEKSYRRDKVLHRVGLHVQVTATLGESLVIHVRDEQGHEAIVSWKQPLEAARNRPLTLELLKEQFGRLGGTPFYLLSVELAGTAQTGPAEAGVMVPKSVLNDLRRQAVDILLAQRQSERPVNAAGLEVLAELRQEALAAGRVGHQKNITQPVLTVLVRTPEQLGAILEDQDSRRRVGLVYCELPQAAQNLDAMALIRGAGVAAALATPQIVRPGEEAALDEVVKAAPEAVLVRNLSALSYLRQAGPDLPLIGDASLNAANELACGLLSQWGLARITPCYDLDCPGLTGAVESFPAQRLEVVTYQHVPMFHSQHCLWAARLSKAASNRVAAVSAALCRDCGRPCRSRSLHVRDRLGVRHPVLADELCRNTIFHGQAGNGCSEIRELLRLGVRHFRLELLDETPAQVKALLARQSTEISDWVSLTSGGMGSTR